MSDFTPPIDCDKCGFNHQSDFDCNLFERLAALEHEQWAHWTRYMLHNLTLKNIERWKRQIETPYHELTDEEKQSDRVWATKVMTQLHVPNDEVKP
jgi:hypothetical protein